MSISTSTLLRLFSSSKIPHSHLHPNPKPFFFIKTPNQTLKPSNPSSFSKPISMEQQRLPTNPLASPTSIPLQPISDLPPKLQQIINLFQSVPDPKAKYQQLLFYGNNLNPLDPQFKTLDNKVQGCVSQVWVRAYLDGDKNVVVFEADSDSALTKGLAALLVQGLSGEPVEEVLRVSPGFVTLLGLQQSLTPSRNNGFVNMLELMQKKAVELFVGSGENPVQYLNSGENPVQNSNSGENPVRNSKSDAGKVAGDVDFEAGLNSETATDDLVFNNGENPVHNSQLESENGGFADGLVSETMVSDEGNPVQYSNTVAGKVAGAEKGLHGGENPVQNSQLESENGDFDIGLISEKGPHDDDLVSNSDDDDIVVDELLGSRGRRIKERLERELKPIELVVEDISYQHAGHEGVRGSDGGETHFNVKVVSKEFEGKSLVKRHRMVYGLLQEELQSGLHALSIVAKTPSEV